MCIGVCRLRADMRQWYGNSYSFVSKKYIWLNTLFTSVKKIIIDDTLGCWKNYCRFFLSQCGICVRVCFHHRLPAFIWYLFFIISNRCKAADEIRFSWFYTFSIWIGFFIRQTKHSKKCVMSVHIYVNLVNPHTRTQHTVYQHYNIQYNHCCWLSLLLFFLHLFDFFTFR